MLYYGFFLTSTLPGNTVHGLARVSDNLNDKVPVPVILLEAHRLNQKNLNIGFIIMAGIELSYVTASYSYSRFSFITGQWLWEDENLDTLTTRLAQYSGCKHVFFTFMGP